MKTRLRKWGNSLALRIPKSFASEVGLHANHPVELSLRKGKIVLAPIVEKGLKLEKMLAGVTEENLHREFDSGRAVGREQW